MNTNSRGTVTGPFSFSAWCTRNASRRPYSDGFDPVGDGAHPVVQQRPVDEPRPDVERVDQFAREPLEAPGLVGVHDELVVVVEEPV